MALTGHSTKRIEQAIKLTFDPIGQVDTVLCDPSPDFKKIVRRLR